LLELAQAPDAGVGVVVADPAAQPLGDIGEQLAPGRGRLELRVHLASGPLGVAKVGQEEAILAADDRQPAGAAEPREPANARDRIRTGVAKPDQVADQELIELLVRDERGESLGAALGAHRIALFSISSPSRYPSGPFPDTAPIASPSSTDFVRHLSREETSERCTSTA